MNNILILSAGRRVVLVEQFKQAVKELGLDSLVFASDSNPRLSSACFVADNSFELPSFIDGRFETELLSLCKKQDITMVIPTIDTGLVMLSRCREVFAENGIAIIISDQELIQKFRDKRKTSVFFNSCNMSTPALMNRDELTYPCFCKPYDGSLSVGAFLLDAPESLTDEILTNDKNIFMEYVPIEEYDEYTVDLYFNQSGALRCVVPRLRIEVRGGEVSKAKTGNEYIVSYLNRHLAGVSGARGVLTLQLFFRESDCDIECIEVNPRFGGGFPLTNEAGGKYPKWLISEYIQGSIIAYYDDWKRDLIMLRYDGQVFIDGYCNK